MTKQLHAHEKAMFSRELENLRAFTINCRESMHEPDEQGISAHVVGDHLDNAMGSNINETLILQHNQELVVILQKESAHHPLMINLANLIALARMAQIPE